MKFKKIYLAVMDFNRVTVEFYEIEKEEMKSIATEIDADNEDEVVIEFFTRQGHRESEVHYMFSEREIELVNH